MRARVGGLLAIAVLASAAPAGAATLTTFPVPTASAGLSGTAAAPDGSLWVTERATRKVAHVGLGGASSEYAVPNKTAGSPDNDTDIGPTQIVADASGATMDFLTDIGSSVGLVTPAGGVTTFHDGSDNAQSISAANGGGVWEVFYLSSRSPELEAAIVRADGSLLGYPGASKIGYGPMATRGDGRMFWGDGGDALRSLTETASGDPQDTPVGGEDRHRPPRPGRHGAAASLGAYDPGAIAFGGDGALWFIDANANRVGRVALDAALFPTAPPSTVARVTADRAARPPEGPGDLPQGHPPTPARDAQPPKPAGQRRTGSAGNARRPGDRDARHGTHARTPSPSA